MYTIIYILHIDTHIYVYICAHTHIYYMSTYPHQVVKVGAGQEAVDFVDDVAPVHDLAEDVL